MCYDSSETIEMTKLNSFIFTREHETDRVVCRYEFDLIDEDGEKHTRSGEITGDMLKEHGVEMLARDLASSLHRMLDEKYVEERGIDMKKIREKLRRAEDYKHSRSNFFSRLFSRSSAT